MVKEFSALTRISRQWLNKLVDSEGVPGIRRKPNGRLEFTDEGAALEWARQTFEWRRIERRQPKDWSARAKKNQTEGARCEIEIAISGGRADFSSIAQLAKEYGVSRQGIYQAIDRHPDASMIKGMLYWPRRFRRDKGPRQNKRQMQNL